MITRSEEGLRHDFEVRKCFKNFHDESTNLLFAMADFPDSHVFITTKSDTMEVPIPLEKRGLVTT
jgi:hypothetical protein